MTDKQQPEALRLAKMLTANEWPGHVTLVSYAQECVAELLRQHAENETLRAGYAAARLEIESLKAQLHAAKQINAAQFGLLAASIPGSALRASHGQAPSATTFCWATELAMVREPVTLTVREAREVSDQMQRLHAASFKTELRNLTSIDLDGDQAVRLAFMSCRAASAFKRAAYAALPDEGEPWRGHKFKEVQLGCWRCDCGKTIKEVTSDQSTPASGGNYPVMPKRYTVDDDGEELFTAEKMRAFADATHALRASHGQAPAAPKGGIDE